MKLCKDCKHVRDTANGINALCLHPDFTEPNFVTGGVAGFYAQRIRENEDRCGRLAKLFEPIVLGEKREQE